MTKISIDLPSAAIGAGASAALLLALTSPLLAPLRLLDHAGAGWGWTTSALALLAGAAFLTAARPSVVEPAGEKSAQAMHRDALFPASVRQTAGRPAMTPVEWVRQQRQDAPWLDGRTQAAVEAVIANGFADQVRHFVEADVQRALFIALNGIAQSKRQDGAFLRELAVRMQESIANGTRFDVAAYEAKSVELGYDPSKGRKSGWFSPFQTVDLVALLIAVRREHGVVASAEFLWLKTVDRGLWYALNNAGRRQFHVESAGVLAHYYKQQEAMQKSGEKLDGPMVQEAVNGLLEYFDRHGLDLVADTEPVQK